MDITYTVEFFTYWHCGSGLSAGADVDALVVKDGDGLPFIPGKTLKGLLREAAEDLLRVEGGRTYDIDRIFGEAYKTDWSSKEKPAVGEAFFANATFPEEDKAKIIENGLQKYLFTSLSNTAIDENGCAKAHSLRKTEVALPCTLEGTIMNVPDESAEFIGRCFGLIKRLGAGRNRGLGRCKFTPIK